MNRRELLLCGLAIPAASVADCRDDKGMIQPDGDDASCISLVVNQAIHIDGRAPPIKTGRALFGFGAYETLRAHQAEKRNYPFNVYGKHYTMKVTRLSVDVNREIGCVVCEVHGRLYE